MKILARNEIYEAFEAEKLMAAGIRDAVNNEPPVVTGYLLAAVLPGKTIVTAIEIEDENWIDDAATNWVTGAVEQVTGGEPVACFSLTMRTSEIMTLGVVFEPEGYVHSAGLLMGHIPMPVAMSESLHDRLEETARALWGQHWAHLPCPKHGGGVVTEEL